MTNYREFLINKSDVVVASKELAVVLGSVEEAIVVNQIYYWLDRLACNPTNNQDGRVWVYNSYQKWHDDNFPFWSNSKIQRIFYSLEDKGVLISANYNKFAFDKTKWYTIDYDKLQELIDVKHEEDAKAAQAKKEETEKSIFFDIQVGKPLPNVEQPIPETTTETNPSVSQPVSVSQALGTKSRPSVNNGFSEKEKPSEVYTPTCPTGCVAGCSETFSRDLSKKTMEMRVEYVAQLETMAGNFDNADVYEQFRTMFTSYLGTFMEKTGKWHPILKDETIGKVISNVLYASDKFGMLSDLLSREDVTIDELIDEHFNTNYGQEINWCIVHFSQPGVIMRLARRIIQRKTLLE